jgi:hypothetical protein
MRKHTGLLAAAVLALGAARAPAQQPQQSPPPPADPDRRMDQFERRLDDMERRHKAELEARDEKIRKLEEQARQRAITPTPTDDEIERTKNDVLKDIDSQAPLSITKRVPASFNPGPRRRRRLPGEHLDEQ